MVAILRSILISLVTVFIDLNIAITNTIDTTRAMIRTITIHIMVTHTIIINTITTTINDRSRTLNITLTLLDTLTSTINGNTPL